jgi:hypothetical protein
MMNAGLTPEDQRDADDHLADRDQLGHPDRVVGDPVEEADPPAVGDLRMLGFLGRGDRAGREPLEGLAVLHPCRPTRPEDLLPAGVEPLVAEPQAGDQPDPTGLAGAEQPPGERRFLDVDGRTGSPPG